MSKKDAATRLKELVGQAAKSGESTATTAVKAYCQGLEDALMLNEREWIEGALGQWRLGLEHGVEFEE